MSRILHSPNDLIRVYNLIKEEWGENYANEFFKEFKTCDNINKTILIALIDNSIVGSATIVKSEIDFDLWGITWVIVDKAHRGKGIGKKLINDCEHLIRQLAFCRSQKSIYVELTTNKPTFYEKLGYKQITEIGKGQMMIKEIKPWKF